MKKYTREEFDKLKEIVKLNQKCIEEQVKINRRLIKSIKQIKRWMEQTESN